MGYPLATYQAIHQAGDSEKQLHDFIKRTNALVGSFKAKRIKYTGDFVLLKKDMLGKYVVLGIFNPDTATEGSEPEWDLALPIPDEDSIKEFMGW